MLINISLAYSNFSEENDEKNTKNAPLTTENTKRLSADKNHFLVNTKSAKKQLDRISKIKYTAIHTTVAPMNKAIVLFTGNIADIAVLSLISLLLNLNITGSAHQSTIVIIP
jgi:hypothetical protein